MKRDCLLVSVWMLVAAGCLGLVACSPAMDWRTVRPEHASALQALFPCKPTQLDRTVALPALGGRAVPMHLVSCKVGESMWALSYFDAQDITQVPLAMAADNRALRDNLEAVGRLGSPSDVANVSAEDLGPVQIPGMTPQPLSRHWRLLGRRPVGKGGESVPVEVHAWHFSHGLMVYQASLWRPVPPANAKDSTDDVETFIQGFKFSD